MRFIFEYDTAVQEQPMPTKAKFLLMFRLVSEVQPLFHNLLLLAALLLAHGSCGLSVKAFSHAGASLRMAVATSAS